MDTSMHNRNKNKAGSTTKQHIFRLTYKELSSFHVGFLSLTRAVQHFDFPKPNITQAEGSPKRILIMYFAINTENGDLKIAVIMTTEI